MSVIINGVPCRGESEYLGRDRIIRLPNIDIELTRTENGGWREFSTMYHAPNGGSGAGHELRIMAREPWVSEQMWRRIVELEDELRALRKAIAYRE